MKKLIQILLLSVVFSLGCNKNKKGCWQAWDGYLVEVRGLLVCDKTKAEAKAMYGQYFFSVKDEPRNCWLLSNNVHYSCIPRSIMEEFCTRQGLSFLPENCTSMCLYNRNKNSGLLAYVKAGPVD